MVRETKTIVLRLQLVGLTPCQKRQNKNICISSNEATRYLLNVSSGITKSDRRFICSSVISSYTCQLGTEIWYDLSDYCVFLARG